MKLYKIEAKDNDTQWVGSQSEAATARKHLGAKGIKRNEITTTEVEVPTNKAGLLEFLNGREHV